MTGFLQNCETGGAFLAAGSIYEKSKAVILGAPMDFTVSFRPGSRSGPQAIRAASVGLEEYSMYAGCDLRDASFYDAGDLLLPFGSVDRSLSLIEEAVDNILTDGKFPLLLGGEHLVSLGALRAFARHNPGMTVIHLDAHADLRTDYLGEAHSHASVMYHACRDLKVDLYQFGIRSATAEEMAFAKEHTHFYPFHVSQPLAKVVQTLKERPVYLSLDIDVVDPAFAPGTGTPEPGGITSAELLEAMSLLKDLNIIGMDLVEVAPVYDPAEITAMLAAKIVREAILTFPPQGDICNSQGQIKTESKDF
ncbi:agmatinase [Dethiobacter alkaliphilus]|uniref:agmatinase n=1 Tax=Dethiobacter alkaliphilus TaxID=427926 RepID=UPI002225D3EB|nr:agmatinase [Dethiobacter alkaliphilus]MCW3488900.1 agmatinase [Dethiobacter alkaliphilus]